MHESPESRVARLILVWVTSIFALLTVLTHISQIFGIPFNVYVMIGALTTVIVSAAVLWRNIPLIKSLAAAADRRVSVFLLLCCVFGALLALVSYRSSTDDAVYLPNAVYYMENPETPMGFAVHFMDFGKNEPPVSYHRFSLPFEYVQALTATATHLNLLTVYYILAPALFGFMIPLVWFYLLSRFTKSAYAAVFGALLICVCLLLMGGQYRSYGNFAFNRIFQGKTVVFAIGIPLFTALTIDYFRVASLRTWLYLLALSTALIGCSVGSTVLVPLLAIVLAMAGSIAYLRGVKRRIIHGVLYLGSLVYPAVYAASILLYSVDQLGTGTAVNSSFWPRSFLAQATWVLGDPAVIVLMVLGTIAATIFLKKENRTFLGIWFVAIIVLYLNPVVSPFLIEHVTTPNIYWRLFYLLPFPLVIGLSGVALISHLENQDLKWRLHIPGMVILALLLAHVPSSVFRYQLVIPTFEVDYGPRHRTGLQWPGYKIARSYKLARNVLDIAPPEGTMLAPKLISCMVAMQTARYKHVCYREDVTLVAFGVGRKSNEHQLRVEANTGLRGIIGETQLSSIDELVKRYPLINTVVAYPAEKKRDRVRLKTLLSKRGFTNLQMAGTMLVFSRPQPIR
jgi:hypothetical protein